MILETHFSKIETDENLMEKALHGDSTFPYKLYLENMTDFDFNCVDWHWHTEFEFVYIETGSVTFNIGETQFELTAGNGIFINTKVLHQMHSEGDALIPNFLFHPTFVAPAESLIYTKYVQPITDSAPDYIIFSPSVNWQREIINKMQSVIKEGYSDLMNELRISFLVQQIILSIYTHTEFCQNNNTKKGSDLARLQIMMQYIQSHYFETITLNDIAGSANLSKSTTLNLFQNILDISPVNYLIKYRLKKSADLLLNTEKKINTISIETGFNNVEYFCKSFKKIYGVTPSEYRRNHETISVFI